MSELKLPMHPDSSDRLRRPVVWVAQGYWVERIFNGIARYAAEHGWILEAKMQWARGSVGLPECKPDGIIVFTGDATDLEKAVRDFGVPVVDLEDYIDRYGAPKVIGDDRRSGRLAARHLAACGPSRLVAVLPDRQTSTGMWSTRMAAFREEGGAAGLPVVSTTLAEFDPVAITREGPVGVFAGGDVAGVEIIRRCLDAGVKVPEMVSVLGCDDTPLVCDLAEVPLSSIRVDFEIKGRRAAELLDRLMKGGKPPSKPVIVPPSGITLRTSTLIHYTGHEVLDGLVRYLRDNSHRHVGLDGLCEEAGVPLRTAHHLAKSKLDTTLLGVLTGFRLNNAERLARSTDLKVDVLAKTAGFSGRAALYRARRKFLPADSVG